MYVVVYPVSMTNEDATRKERPIMVRKNLYMPRALWDNAKEKADQIESGMSLAQVVRRLLERWLKGEIGL